MDFIERSFQREGSLYIACNDRHAFSPLMQLTIVVVSVRIIFSRLRYWNYCSFFRRLWYITSFQMSLNVFKRTESEESGRS